MRFGRRIRPLLGATAAAACLAVGLTPSVAVAALAVDHLSATIAEDGSGGDGIVGPGDRVRIDETVISSDAGLLTSVSGTLSAATSGLTVAQATAGYPDLAFGVPGTNSSPFLVDVGSEVDCGARLGFRLGLSTAQGSQDISFDVPTGEPGALQSRESTDVPRQVPDGGTAGIKLDISQAGRVKGVRVRIGRIVHPYVGDLRLTLVAPNGARVLLFDRRGADGDDLVDTTFSQTAETGIAAGSAPFTGTYRPEEDLRALDGVPLQGTWTLEVRDSRLGDVGRIEAWGADVAPAICTGAPSASIVASPNPVTPGSPVSLDASGSTDPNGTIVGYQWDLDGDNTFETDTGATPLASVTFTEKSTRTVRVRVTDDVGETGTAAVDVAVTVPPTARAAATPTSPLTGQTVSFDASASTDSDGTIANYSWDLDGNGTFETSTGTTPSAYRAYDRPGTVPVRVRVTDDNGATGTAAVDVTVQNRPPTARLTAPSLAVRGESVRLSATESSDPDGTVDNHEWDLDGNGSYETVTGPRGTVDHTFTSSGSVTVRLRVTDDWGAEATTSATVTVTARPKAVLTATPTPAVARKPVALDGSGSADPDGSIARYQWDLDGDGSYEADTGTSARSEITLPGPGSRTVRLRVTDNHGVTDAVSVEVTATNAAPTASLSASPMLALTNQTVAFDASGSSDPDGEIVRFEWDLDGDGRYERDSGRDPRTGRTYPAAGVITVRVRVTDQDGGQASRVLDIAVMPPISATAGTTAGGAGTTQSTITVPPGAAGTIADPTQWFAGPSEKLRAALVGVPIQRLKTVLRKGLVVYCLADRPARCSLRAWVSRKTALTLRLASRTRTRTRRARRSSRSPQAKASATKRSKKRTSRSSARKRKTKKKASRTVTVARRSAAAGEVRLKLSSKARRSLKRKLKGRRRVAITVSGTVRDADGTRIKVRRTVLLRR